MLISRSAPGGSLTEHLSRAGIARVFGFPSVACDQFLDDLASDGLAVTITSDEQSAVTAAVASAAVSLRAVAVVVDEAWGSRVVADALAEAEAQLLPVLFVLTRPAGGELPTLTMLQRIGEPNEGLVRGPVLARARSVGQPEISYWAPLRSQRDPVVCRRPSRPIFLLPPPLHPDRDEMVRAVLRCTVPVVTDDGLDPFPRQHPDLWLGRVGFLPSASVRGVLGQPGAKATLVHVPDARLPGWVVAREVFAADQWHGPANAPLRKPAPSPVSGSAAASALAQLQAAVPDALVVGDAGTAHRLVARDVANHGKRALLTSGLTPMGWSLAATLGAGLTEPETPIITVLGDGAALISGLDLALLVKHRVPALVLLLDNRSLGTRSAPGRALAAAGKPPVVDWLGVARAVGAQAIRWPDGDSGAVLKAWRDCRSQGLPLLVHRNIDIDLRDYADFAGIESVDRQWSC